MARVALGEFFFLLSSSFFFSPLPELFATRLLPTAMFNRLCQFVAVWFLQVLTREDDTTREWILFFVWNVALELLLEGA